MNKNYQVISRLELCGIVPVIKIEDVSKAGKLAEALISGGIDTAEITFRAEGAEKAIENIKSACPEMIVGGGTVLTTEQADKAIASGADFLVAPGFNPAIAKHCIKRGIPYIPGISTCSELEQALSMGFRAVKFFPAEQSGGLKFIKAISAPYSGVKFMPTGGINEDNLQEYLSFDRVFACGGSWMVGGDLIRREKWDEITALSKSAVGKMLGFEFAHIGINSDNAVQAEGYADAFIRAFDFSSREGNSNVFVGDNIEITVNKYIGQNGHIAIKTNSVLRAAHYLERKGFSVNMASAKYNDKNLMYCVFLEKDFGGFAVHLIQRR